MGYHLFMKKRNILFLLPIIVLCGCNNIASKYSIKSINYLDSIDDLSEIKTPITSQQISASMRAKSSFMVLFYSTDCGSCSTFKENVIRYQKENNVLIYYYDCYNSLTNLYTLEPSLKGKIDYPCFLIFKNGNVVYTITKQKIENSNTFKSVLKNHHTPSLTSYLESLSALTNYLENKEESYIITYDSKSENDLNYINSFYVKNDKNTLVLDKNRYNNEIIEQLNTYFEIDSFNDSTCAYYNKLSQEKSTIDYHLS